jgi:predicted XRE-type DNA-binding protein
MRSFEPLRLLPLVPLGCTLHCLQMSNALHVSFDAATARTAEGSFIHSTQRGSTLRNMSPRNAASRAPCSHHRRTAWRSYVPRKSHVGTHFCNMILATIASIIEAKDLTQTQAADLTGQQQTDISSIINYRHDDYSVWPLMKVLSALGADIGIVINPDSGNERGIILPETLEAPEETVAPGMGP